MGGIFEKESFRLFINLFYVKFKKPALPHDTKPSDVNSECLYIGPTKKSTLNHLHILHQSSLYCIEIVIY